MGDREVFWDAEAHGTFGRTRADVLMKDDLRNLAPNGQTEDVRILFEGSDRPRGPSPLSDGSHFLVRVEVRTDRFRKDLGNTIPVNCMSVGHQGGIA